MIVFRMKNSDEPPAKRLKIKEKEKEEKDVSIEEDVSSLPKRTVMKVFSSMRTFSIKKKRKKKRRRTKKRIHSIRLLFQF